MPSLTPLITAAKRASDAGDEREAERLWRLILAQDPGNVPAARALGTALLDSHHYSEAYQILAAAVRNRPFDADLRALMGRCCLSEGRLPAARSTFENILREHPHSVAAKTGLALCLCAAHRAADALALLGPILDSHPTDADVRLAAGRACYLLVLAEDATAHFRAAVQARPSSGLRTELGWALYMARKPDEALAEFDRVLASEPTFSLAIAGRARILTDRREYDEARRQLKPAVERGSLDSAILTAHARLARTPGERAESARLLERRISVPQPHALRGPLLIMLGKLKEADGDYDSAFDCFRQANQGAPEFPLSTMLKSHEQAAAAFTRDTLSALPRNPESDPLPVFIVGMPRSGTSLVEQILSSHPEVHAGDELPYLQQIASNIARRIKSLAPYPSCVPSMTARDAQEAGRSYLSRLRALHPYASRITDKMPSNFVLAGLIDMCLPGARIIHCYRSPLDTCLSIYSTSLGPAHDYRRRLPDLAAAYLAYHRLMAHWRTVLRVPMLDVCYEQLIAEPEAVSRRMIEFVGLPWDARCLRFYESGRITPTASTDQVRRPIYQSSVNRWKHYERHLGELIDGLRGLEEPRG